MARTPDVIVINANFDLTLPSSQNGIDGMIQNELKTDVGFVEELLEPSYRDCKVILRVGIKKFRTKVLLRVWTNMNFHRENLPRFEPYV